MSLHFMPRLKHTIDCAMGWVVSVTRSVDSTTLIRARRCPKPRVHRLLEFSAHFARPRGSQQAAVPVVGAPLWMESTSSACWRSSTSSPQACEITSGAPACSPRLRACGGHGWTRCPRSM